MQEFRIALKVSVPFNLEVHNPAVGMIEILKKAQSEIAKKFGINMDLDHAIVRPREPKAAKPVTATEVARFNEQMDAASSTLAEALAAPIAERVVKVAEAAVAEAPLVFAPGREPATAGESADSLLSGTVPWKKMAESAKAKREAEKTGEAS